MPDAADDVDGLAERIDPWPGVSLSPPTASIASQKPPAPMPSSMRPPLSRSRLATERASTTGWRNERLSTLPAMWMRSVLAATQLMSVHVSWNAAWYG